MIVEITIPAVGEHIVSGDIVNILVAVGDMVAVDQGLVEFETDKAVVEIPSTVAGRVVAILVKLGETVKIGTVIASIDVDAKQEVTPLTAAPSQPSLTSQPPTVPSQAGRPSRQPPAPKREAPPRHPTPSQSLRVRSEQAQQDSTPVAATLASEPSPALPPDQSLTPEPGPALPPDQSLTPEPSPALPPDQSLTPAKVPASLPADPAALLASVAPASPSVRRIARELGVDIHNIRGSGPGGRISVDDIKLYVKGTLQAKTEAPSRVVATAPQPAWNLPDFQRWGVVRREPMTKIRRVTAANVSHAWQVVPQVTQFDQADITELEAFRKQYAPLAEKAGGKLTFTAILLKVLARALRKFPQLNASLDPEREEIIFRDYWHIGVAVDTEHGLLVPVIRDVDQQSLLELAVALSDIARRARARQLKPEEFEGGTFTISNQGGIGGTNFTPIVNWPQVAILGVSQSSLQPVYRDGQFQPRLILPLALSYDHRIIDGADASRFLRWVAESLATPMRLHLDLA